MRVALLALAAVIAWNGSAQAANKQVWHAYKSADEVQVAYGVPESDVITIIFRCALKPQKHIEIVTSVLPRKPKKDRVLRTTLTNGGRAVAHDGKIGRSGEDYHFVATTAAEPKAVAILKPGALLSIGIPGRQVQVPLRGVVKPLAEFEAACFGKR